MTAIKAASKENLIALLTPLAKTVKGKAEAAHIHSEYAEKEHSHTGYAKSDHSHTEYAVTDHEHSGYASATHSHAGLTPATQTANGLMSAADKTKLDNYPEYSRLYTDIETSLAGVIEMVNGKADTDHSHSASDITSGVFDAARIPALPYAPASSTTATDVTAIPVAHSLVVASVSASASFKLASTPAAGREVHVIIKNTSSAAITITLPTSGGYSSDADSLSVPANGIGEVNAVSDGTTIYLRSVS